MRPCAVHAEGITCMQLPDAARSEQGCQGYLCLLKQPEPVAWPDRTALVAQVTLLGVSKDLEACGRMAAAQRLLNPAVSYACLQHEHFEPFTVATQPFEQLSHAVLHWLVQHQNDCDVVQVRSASPAIPLTLDLHRALLALTVQVCSKAALNVTLGSPCT